MKVLLLFSSSDLGGAERSLCRMAFNSNVVHYSYGILDTPGPLSDWVLRKCYKPVHFTLFNSSSLLLSIISLFIYLQKNTYNALYICGLRASFFIRLLRFIHPKIKLIHAIRWNPNSNSKVDFCCRFVERHFSTLNDYWITNSQAAKICLIKNCSISSNKISVIYNGIESSNKNKISYQNKPFEVLTVANLNPRKGHIQYLKVIKLVTNRIPNVKFIFIGRDDMSGVVQDAIKKVGLDNSVKFIGFQHNITEWLNRARIFVLPSLWGEGCPTSIIEAFSYSLPVISSSIDGIPEIVNHGVDGYLVNPHNKEKFAEYICDLLFDNEKSRNMGNKGNIKVLNQFSLSGCTRNHDRVIHNLLN